MPSFLGHLSVDELALLSFMAWNDGTTTEDRARHTAIQTYDEIDGEDPGKHGFTNFDSGSARRKLRCSGNKCGISNGPQVNSSVSRVTRHSRLNIDSTACATTATATGIWRGIAQQPGDRTAVARAVAEAGKVCSKMAEAGIRECSRLEKEEEEKVTQVVEVVDVP